MFLILSEIYDFGSINGWIVFDFRFLSRLGSNVSVRYITTLSLFPISSSIDLCLRLLIDDKDGIS